MPHVHLYKTVILSERHIHRYAECRCGKRIVSKHGCCQPIAQYWLDGRDYGDDPMRPPRGPNDLSYRRPLAPTVFHPTITWTWRDYVLRAIWILVPIALCLWFIFCLTSFMIWFSEH